MKTLARLAVMAAFGLLVIPAPRLQAAEEGVALAIIYDTSGSMRDPVRNDQGEASPKYVVANQALIAVARQIEAFATNAASGPRTVQTTLFTFRGESFRQVIPMGPFDAAAIERFARDFSSPSGNTPLGNTLSAASRAVLNSPLARKHVLVITDGMNTAGPSPAQVLPGLKRQADQKGALVNVHFVAFDVDSKIFAPLKKLGVTVVGAADEKQLNSQLQFILQKKILLEDEEAPKPASK